MTGAREEVLARIRTALADRPVPAAVVRDYRGVAASKDHRLIDLFVERVTDYRADVARADDMDVRRTIAQRLAARGATHIALPDGFPAEWIPEGMQIETEPIGIATLDTVHAVLTTCAVAIAETGTVVLDAGLGMGPRALTLVPDHHVVVVRAEQIVAGVPDAVAAIDPSRPHTVLTWISGPSATSDIELNRVEGVHGPRNLDIVICPGHAG